MRKFLTADEFRQAAKDKTLADAGTVRHFAAEIEKGAEGSRTLTFTISTEDVDRMGDVISIDGWDLANFQANPVVLWAHNSRDLPIARATKIWKHSKKLKATAEFVPADMPVIGPLADAVYQMYQAGFLNATSVGMMPKKWAWSTDDSRPFGIDFQEHELLEFSAVPIPANPKALIGAKAAGIDVAPVMEWARGILTLNGDGTPTVDARAIEREFFRLIREAGTHSVDCIRDCRHAHGMHCGCKCHGETSKTEPLIDHDKEKDAFEVAAKAGIVSPHEFRRRQIEIARLG